MISWLKNWFRTPVQSIPTIELLTPSSDCADYIRYNKLTKQLDVRLINAKAGTWAHKDVPLEVFVQLASAESVGLVFNNLVKGKYQAVQIL